MIGAFILKELHQVPCICSEINTSVGELDHHSAADGTFINEINCMEIMNLFTLRLRYDQYIKNTGLHTVYVHVKHYVANVSVLA